MSTSHIEINPNVMLGKPVVRGTPIPVELVLRKLGEGASMEDLCDAYPKLKAEDIYACHRLCRGHRRPRGNSVNRTDVGSRRTCNGAVSR